MFDSIDDSSFMQNVNDAKNATVVSEGDKLIILWDRVVLIVMFFSLNRILFNLARAILY